MDRNKVLTHLCYRDVRNPDCIIHFDPDCTEEDLKVDDCYCDNCFYGKTKLAEELLKYIDKYGEMDE